MHLSKTKITILSLLIMLLLSTSNAFSGAGDSRQQFRWPNNTIFYYYDTDILSVVEMAVKMINAKSTTTGITIKLCTPENNCTINANNPVKIISTTEDECGARFVGYRSFSNPFMSVGPRCVVGSIIHEFGHVIGLHHEHVRPDRDNYVKVDREKAELGRKHLFDIVPTAMNQGEYDYLSTMHYDKCAFMDNSFSCTNGDRTVESPGDLDTGFRPDFSEQDLQSIRAMYSNLNIKPNDGKDAGGNDTIFPDDVYNFTQNSVSVRQSGFPGNNSSQEDPRNPEDFGLLYNDGDYNDNITNIEIVNQPQGSIDINQSQLGDFDYSFPSGVNIDSFTYRLRDSVNSLSDPVTVTLSNSAPQETRTLTIIKSDSVGGTVNSSPIGITCGSDCLETYDLNESVVLAVVVNGGWQFTGWSNGCNGTSTTTNVTMDQDRICQANFSQNSNFTLNVTKNGSGTVTSTPSGISCGSDCSQIYAQNTNVTLSATPSSGWSFSHWSGFCTGSSTVDTVLMNSNKTCTANFTQNPVNVTLTVSKTGSGTVTSVQSGINCGSDCSNVYQQNTTINLNASPSSGWRFSHWTLSCVGQTTSTSVLMTSNKSCRAVFVEDGPTNRSLSVNKNGLGTVVSTPSGINCGADCSHDFTSDSTVRLQASANATSGYKFSSWSGSCSTFGANVSIDVPMDANKTCTANFILDSTVDVSVSINGSGTVSSSPSGINCGSDCAQTYSLLTSLQLTANPSPGWSFLSWGGTNCNSLATVLSRVLTYDMSCTANFVQD